jgi:lipopolysaccharide/colanic/teichoic acid biosynthesis glycosyltransferase
MTIDFILSIFILILISPILFLTAFLILIFEGRPIFYVSIRTVGIDKEARIIKFRTMVRDASSEKFQLKQRFMRNGFLDIPLASDVYTPVGRILERLQIVETLQLINILMCDMSLVGNRPLPRENIDLLKSINGWVERFNSPAGITGPAQIIGKYSLDPKERIYIERLYSSLYNNPNANLIFCDAYIIYRTGVLLLTGKSLSYSDCIKFLLSNGANRKIPPNT